MNIKEQIAKIKAQGYDQIHAEARLCQDIIIQALAKSTLNQNVTIKGGVVMRSISKDARRATRDLDIDFLRYSLEDSYIDNFIKEINCLDRISIRRIGDIEELKQQDYHGKRIHIKISDSHSTSLISKIDLGVHKDLSIKQEEYCFDICFTETNASLLINSKEQMFTEKLRSFLKFGSFSTRYKDIFDMYYLCPLVDKKSLLLCFEKYIFNDTGMKENNLEDIIRRVTITFENSSYRRKLETTETNWLKMDSNEVLEGILHFFNEEI